MHAGLHPRITGVCLLSVLLCACITPNPADSAAMASRPLHALMTGELDLHLARLNALSFDLHRTQSELDQLRSQNSEAIAQAAVELREAAAGIHVLGPEIGLPEQNILPFHELATRLEQHAAALEIVARERNFTSLARQMADIEATCNACHALYRGR